MVLPTPSGEQLVNHIPNCKLLTNKLGLLCSLQEYERVTLLTKGRTPRMKMTDFIPETYKLDERLDREKFLSEYNGEASPLSFSFFLSFLFLGLLLVLFFVGRECKSVFFAKFVRRVFLLCLEFLPSIIPFFQVYTHEIFIEI